MVVDAVTPTVTQKIRRNRINYALAGTLLANGLTWEEIAKQVGAGSAESLRVGCARKGVTKPMVRNLEPKGEARVTVTARLATEADAILRERANGLLGAQLGKLASKPVGKLHSKGQGDAAVLKTLAETWRTLNGNPDSISIQFGVGARPDDLIATPQPVVSCGPTVDITEQSSTPPVQDTQSQ